MMGRGRTGAASLTDVRVGLPTGLTVAPSFHTLGLVHRLLTVLLGLVVASTSGQISALHIHQYTDHDHPEHHHGPAAHDHQRPSVHHDEDDGGAHLEPCDPGHHAVSVTMGCMPLPKAHASDAECPNPGVVEPLVSVHPVPAFTDVRVHGPPPLTQAAPRAPPPSSPA